MQVKSTAMARLVAAGLLGGAVLLGGCGSSRRGDGRIIAGPGSGAGTTAGVTSGAFGGAGGAAAQGPDVDVLSPARGTHTASRQVLVEGVVTDLGGGVAEVHVAGRTAQLDPLTGAFQAQVDLTPGLQTVVVEAWDTAGQRTERHVSVLVGDLVPEDQLVANAGSVRITDTALDLLEPGIAQGIEAQRAAIRQQVLASPVQDVDLKDFGFGAVTADVDAVPGGLRLVVEIRDVVLRIKASTRILLVFKKSVEGDVKASSMRLEALAQVGVQNGQPTVTMGQVTATAAGLTVPDWAAGERRRIQEAFEKGFADAGRKNVEDALVKALGSTQTQGSTARDAFGKPIEIAWGLDALTCDDDGVTAAFGANVRAQAPAYGDALTGSIALGTPGPTLVGSGVGAGPDVGLTVHEDLMNRALHAAWRAGALQFTLDQATMDRLFPGVPSQMDTTALLMSAPQLGQVLPPGLPLVLEVEGLLPPTVRSRPTDPQLFDLDLGGLRVRMDVIHPTEGAVELLTAVFAARVPVGLAEQGGVVQLSAAGSPELHVDVEGFSLPGSEALLEQVTAATGPQLFQGSFSRIQGVQLPAVQGLTVTGLQFSTSEDSLVVLGKATPAVTR